MIVCPNCHHQNIDGANLCEICYTSLPIKEKCPNCSADVLSNATFCGHCGFVLSETPVEIENDSEHEPDTFIENNIENSETALNFINNEFMNNTNSETTENQIATKIIPDVVILEENQPTISSSENTDTQLQVRLASLLHLQTNQVIELPNHLAVIHIGKENDKIPPDIDLSGFPDSQIVSRIHADIRVEADAFYLADVGSANGTYVNHTPLNKGNLHLLRAGDRIAFGKEDKVTFIFQLSN